MISHTKKYGIYHWDTFDNNVLLIDEANTLKEARKKVKERYKDRINTKHGADQVDIVDQKGDIVDKFRVC